MSVAVISLIVLVIVFVIGTVWPINMGSVAFAACFVVGILIAGMKVGEILALFPTNLFTLLAGITYMFGVAQKNGTMNIFTNAAVRLVRGRVAFIPWIFHIIAIVFSGLGAGPAAATAVLAPLALSVAFKAKISPLLIGVMLVHGSHGGSMSPISIIGAIVNGTSETAGLPDSSGPVFFNSLFFNIFLALGAYLLLGGIGLIRRGREELDIDVSGLSTSGSATAATVSTDPEASTDSVPVGSSGKAATAVAAAPTETVVKQSLGLKVQHMVTFVGIVALLVMAIGFRFDVGLTAFTIGLVLTFMSPKEDIKAVAAIAWSTILLLCGIMTYIGVVTALGGMKLVSDALLGAGSPVVAILLLAIMGGITSLFSATGAVIGALIPLIGPLLGANAAIPASGAVSTLAISSSVVDSSPLSLQGAVLMANVPDEMRRSYFKKLFAWGASMVVVGSVLPWLFFVVLPSMGG